MANMLDEALTYLEMGWCVYPAHTIDLTTGFCSCGKVDCPCPGKHPLGRWMDFQNRRPTIREVKLWFRNMDCNVGTVTGTISGIVVVDIDGKEGVETAQTLGLEPTLSARTGGGGYHLFYSSRVPIPSRVRALKGIDIRGEGGYVILSPSLHNSGSRYEWLEPSSMANFDPTPFTQSVSAYSGNGRPSLEWVDELLQGVSEGSRNTSAARLAGRYFGLGLSMDEVWILMSAWNERNSPPMEDSELFRTVNAVGRKHSQTSAPLRIDTFGQIMNLLNPNGAYHDK